MGRERLLTRKQYFTERARKSLFIANLVTVSLAGVGMVKLAAKHAWLTNLLNAALVITVTTMNSLNVTNRYREYVDKVEDDTRRHFEQTYLCGICGEGYAHMGLVGFFFTIYVAWLLSDEVRTKTFKDAAQTWLDVAAVFAIVVPQVMSVVADGELQYRVYWDGVKRRRKPEAAGLVDRAVDHDRHVTQEAYSRLFAALSHVNPSDTEIVKQRKAANQKALRTKIREINDEEVKQVIGEVLEAPASFGGDIDDGEEKPVGGGAGSGLTAAGGGGS